MWHGGGVRRLAFALLLAPIATAGCGGGSTGAGPSASDAPSTIHVTTAAAHDGRLGRDYTCDGSGRTPTVRWSGVPRTAKAVAVVVDDPDAPDGTFYHWVVLDLPPTATFVDGSTRAVAATNSGGTTTFEPACPPRGTHRYRFEVYALDRPTGLSDGADLDAALTAIGRHALARGGLTASYAR